MKHITRTLALPAALAAALVLSACGNSDVAGTSEMTGTAPTRSGTPASKARNTADVEFVSMMIPHHAQAIAMADLAVKHATDSKVKALAPKIKAAQSPEIQKMSGWLTGWGEPVPGSASGSDMSGMSGMEGQAGGMMSAKQMASLGVAKGSVFDRMWLQMMVTHHQGAVAMAKTALTHGADPDTKKLARAIIDGQSAEIAQMSAILAEIPT
jgi:uncharacterized protein (DUF305 family)